MERERVRDKNGQKSLVFFCPFLVIRHHFGTCVIFGWSHGAAMVDFFDGKDKKWDINKKKWSQNEGNSIEALR